MNVLSIDFDIIMAPDINLYNPKIGQHGETIDKLIEAFPLLGDVRADFRHYQTLVGYVLETIKDLRVEDIRISNTHEDIKNLLSDCVNATVYNIDHHHDLGYGDRPLTNEDGELICTCANWGDYFFTKGNMTHLVWLKNINSEYNEEECLNKFGDRVEIKNLSQVDLRDLPSMDKIFICLSPEWVPSKYHPLFYTILDLINQQKNCHLEIY